VRGQGKGLSEVEEQVAVCRPGDHIPSAKGGRKVGREMKRLSGDGFLGALIPWPFDKRGARGEEVWLMAETSKFSRME